MMAQKEYGRISENEAKTYCQAKFHVILDEVKKGTPYPWQYNMVFQVWKKVGVVLVEDIINKKMYMYFIENCAGSLIRKEFWLKDMDSDEKASLVVKIEEDKGARNAMEYHVYMDKFPGGCTATDGVIDSKYNIKDSMLYGRFLFGKTSSYDTKWKAGGITDFFNYVSSQFEDL